MRFGPDIVSIWPKAVEKEWLITNGKGGYTSGTVSGANTRRYHGLLVSEPPGGGARRLFVAKLHEEITVAGQTFYLSSNQLKGGEVQDGHIHLVEFNMDKKPTFIYRFGDIYLKKEIFMVHGEATTIVRYTVESNRSCKIRIYPLVNNRSHHAVNTELNWPYKQKCREAQAEIFLPDATLTLAASAGKFSELHTWFYNLSYAHEEERGEEYLEHHFMPGFWEIELESGGEFAVTMSHHGSRTDEYKELYRSDEERQKKILSRVKTNKPLCRELARASEQFIIEKNGEPAIIAGYPWFDEWGRDAFIALPGLMLVTGRFDEAKRLLQKFSRYEKNGILPNMIPDEGEPLYNTVDASLWFFQAVKKYLDYTGDLAFVREVIYPVLKKIIRKYENGTDFGIVMDSDGLITAGEKGVQLTWMDAKVGDWVVTPRHGKAVEVNALWYNALYFMTLLAGCVGDHEARRKYGEMALLVHEKFASTFWCKDNNYLCDCILGGERDRRLRPNQLLALSLPYRLLSAKQEQQVLDAIGRHLYTPFGLRSLAPYEKEYRSCYEGSRFNRDGAYHQGTVWAWLIGPYVTAYRRIHNYSRHSRLVVGRILAPFFHHLYDFGLASIAEIFDGERPYIPRGCPYQAWSVAEVLRAYSEDVLEKSPESKWVCEIST